MFGAFLGGKKKPLWSSPLPERGSRTDGSVSPSSAELLEVCDIFGVDSSGVSMDLGDNLYSRPPNGYSKNEDLERVGKQRRHRRVLRLCGDKCWAQTRAKPVRDDTLTDSMPMLKDLNAVMDVVVKDSADEEDVDSEIYGEAVTMLVSGVAKDELAVSLKAKGYSDASTARVLADLVKILPGSPSPCCVTDSIPTPDSSLRSEIGDTVTKTCVPQEEAEEVEEQDAKYTRMLKMGVPASAVELKMRAEQRPESAIQKVTRTDTCSGLPDNRATSSKYVAAYDKMVRVGVATSVVLQRMRQDGCSEDDVLQWKRRHRITEGYDDTQAANGTSGRRRSMVMRLHWEKIDGGSVFSEHHYLDGEDVATLQQIFASPDQPQQQRERLRQSSCTRKRCALDAKRSQNMTIALARLGGKTEADFTALLRRAVDLDLGVDALERLLTIIPTSEEYERVCKAGDELDTSGIAEQFVLAAAKVPELRAKLEAATVAATFSDKLDEVADVCCIIEAAAEALMESKGLALTLQRILAVGNVMNAGTRRGDAKGIRLHSLLAIVNTKGRDKRTTILDYVVAGLLKRGRFADLAAAADIVDDIENATRLAEGASLDEIRRSLDNIRRRQSVWRELPKLETFLLNADRAVESLERDHVAPTFKSIADLREYFGEASGSVPTQIFGTLACFLKLLARALHKQHLSHDLKFPSRVASTEESAAVNSDVCATATAPCANKSPWSAIAKSSSLVGRPNSYRLALLSTKKATMSLPAEQKTSKPEADNAESALPAVPAAWTDIMSGVPDSNAS